MIVLMTSCEPNRALRIPGTAAHTAPAAIAAPKQDGTSSPVGRFAKTIPDPGGREGRDIQLPFRADVEQSCPKGDGDRQSGENERGGQEERVANPVGPPQGAADQQPVGLERVVADHQHEDAADAERRDDGDDREEKIHEEPAVISIPISAALVTSGSTSPTIRPEWMTSRRSASDITSSSSADTSRMAHPPSRSSTSLR